MALILTDENFDKEIQGSVKPILVDFFATWCGPCSVLGPILEKISNELDGQFILAKADLDSAPLTAQKFRVDKVPTVVVFKNGKPISGFVGLSPEKNIKDWLENIIKENKDKSFTEQQSQIEQLIREYTEYAEKNGFNLNSDKKSVERIIDGLFENEKKHGKKYCPCRRITGNQEEDLKNICPCYYHKDEIEKDGKCFCGIFVK
jgi:thioredoxin